MSPASAALLVATLYRWVADTLAPGAGARGLVTLHSHGLDVPDLGGLELAGVWTAARHAARLARSGWPLPLLAPGPTWLAGVPAELLGRRVWVGRLADLAAGGGGGWAKPAESKVDRLPAGWWDDLDRFADAAHRAGLGPDSWVQVADRRLDLDLEVRLVVVDAAVVAAAPYLRDGSPDISPADRRRLRPAVRDAAVFGAELLAAVDTPPGVVVDVARTRAGHWVVVEANPSWCSGPYTADPAGVVGSILAAFDRAGRWPRWAWRPDPALDRWAHRLPALRPGGFVSRRDG